MFVTKNEVVTAPCLTGVEELIVFQGTVRPLGKGISSLLMLDLIVLRL